MKLFLNEKILHENSHRKEEIAIICHNYHGKFNGKIFLSEAIKGVGVHLLLASLKMYRKFESAS